MIKEIVKDLDILSQKSERFVIGEDNQLIVDLIDTAKAHIDTCAGLACIQIGIPKRVIVVRQGDRYVPYINPVIVGRSGKTYTAFEGCLSLDGEREVKRHDSIKIIFEDMKGKKKCQTFGGFVAQVLQHEIDHCNGILI